MIYASGLCWQGLFWALIISFPAAALAQGAGCAKVTISSAADADAIRKTCKTITGDLIFDFFFNETIDLDGIEVIEGDLSHDGNPWNSSCDGMPEGVSCTSDRFTISSSTLRQINGNIFFWSFVGLEELSFPNLVRAKNVRLQRLYYLKTLDLTNLQYIESFRLEAKNLTKFSLDELKAFTGPTNGEVSVSVGNIENLDGLFRNSLDPWQGWTDAVDPDRDSYMRSGWGVQLSYMHAPNLKSLTFGWKRTPRLHIFTDGELSIVFGGPNSTEMEIDRLELYTSNDVVKLERGKNIKSLRVGAFTVGDMEKIEQLEAPFDQLWRLEISNATELTSVVLPPQAENWTNFILNIFNCPNLNLSSEYTTIDGQRKKTWYWPRSWFDLVIAANMKNEFFESFLVPPLPRIKHDFILSDPSGNLDCKLFDKIKPDPGEPHPWGPRCYSDQKNSSARLMGSLGGGELVLMGMLIIATMIL